MPPSSPTWRPRFGRPALATEPVARRSRPRRVYLTLATLDAAPAAALALAFACLVSVLVRVYLGRKIVTPWIMIDELVYSELAKSFSTSGHFLVRGRPAHITSVVYPVLISPAWRAGSMSTTYGVAKGINAVVMTLAAAPVYLWGQKLAPRRYALAAAGLTLILPSFIYSGTLMTETAFFPAFVLAAFAIGATLERPTALRQLFVLAAIALTCGIRLQGLVLLAVLPTALFLKLFFDARAGELRGRSAFARALASYWPTAAVLAAGVGAYAAYKVAQGSSLSSGLGSYRTVATGGYATSEAARWVLYHFAELPFSVGLLPASALIVMLGLAVRRGAGVRPAERAFLAVAASSVVWVVVEVAVFASRFSQRVEERYMFCLAPLLLLALVLWLGRGLPRPPVLTLLAGALPLALLVFLPLPRLLNVSIDSDTFGLIPLLRLSQIISGGIPRVKDLLLVGAAVGGVAFALTPKRFAQPAFPAALAVFFVLASWVVQGTVRDYAKNLQASSGLKGDPSWIDEALPHGGRAAFLYGTSTDPGQQAAFFWQTAFWNRKLMAAYDLEHQEPGFAAPLLGIDSRDGEVVGFGTSRPYTSLPYVVAETSVALVGRRIAVRPPYGLYRIKPPLKLASSTAGVYGDGWIGAEGSYLHYASGPPGRIKVAVSRAGWGGKDVPGAVTIDLLRLGRSTAPPLAVRKWTVHREQTRFFTLSTPRVPFEVRITVHPTFSPADYGFPDTRQLGAQVGFRFTTR
jgi:hypothetical protein